MMNLVPEKHKLQHSTLINLSNYFDNRLAWFSISFPSPELGPSRLIAITGALEKRSNTAGFVLRRLLISPQYCHLVINEALLLLQPHRELLCTPAQGSIFRLSRKQSRKWKIWKSCEKKNMKYNFHKFFTLLHLLKEYSARQWQDWINQSLSLSRMINCF